MKNILLNATKGIAIGATMLLPGLSGGTAAIMLRIYDNLIRAVADIRIKPLQSFRLLAPVGLGGLIGLVVFAKPLLFLANEYRFYMMYLFMGLIIGSVWLIYKEIENESFSVSGYFWIACGFLISILTSHIPVGFIEPGGRNIYSLVFLFVIGMILSVALILPGISASYMMLVFGIYSPFLNALSEIQLTFLIPLALGLLAGILLTARLLQKLLDTYKRASYMMIIGFVLGSAAEIFPGLPNGHGLPSCAALFVSGFVFTFLLHSHK